VRGAGCKVRGAAGLRTHLTKAASGRPTRTCFAIEEELGLCVMPTAWAATTPAKSPHASPSTPWWITSGSGARASPGRASSRKRYWPFGFDPSLSADGKPAAHRHPPRQRAGRGGGDSPRTTTPGWGRRSSRAGHGRNACRSRTLRQPPLPVRRRLAPPGDARRLVDGVDARARSNVDPLLLEHHPCATRSPTWSAPGADGSPTWWSRCWRGERLLLSTDASRRAGRSPDRTDADGGGRPARDRARADHRRAVARQPRQLHSCRRTVSRSLK